MKGEEMKFPLRIQSNITKYYAGKMASYFYTDDNHMRTNNFSSSRRKVIASNPILSKQWLIKDMLFKKERKLQATS